MYVQRARHIIALIHFHCVLASKHKSGHPVKVMGQRSLAHRRLGLNVTLNSLSRIYIILVYFNVRGVCLRVIFTNCSQFIKDIHRLFSLFE